jgi:hypothetical protein
MCYVLDIQIYAFKQRVCRPQTVSQLLWHGDVGSRLTFGYREQIDIQLVAFPCCDTFSKLQAQARPNLGEWL